MARPFLSVLTAPIPTAPRRIYQGVRRRIRPLVKRGGPLPKASPYPGHYAVVRSVVEGLRAIGADFNFNPRRAADLARVVYAPENAALRQAAELKRRGNIDYLAAGPVNALFPDESDGVLLMPEIDRLIIASDWARELYRAAPQLLEKFVTCPCGVDTRFWQPSGRRRRNLAIVYWKSGDERFCRKVEAIAARCGLEPKRLRSAPGERALFEADEYRRLLDEAAIGIFLSGFETQGLALAESWTMDVPTAVWDPQTTAEWRGRAFKAGSSAPYLTPMTGRRWRTLDELEPTLHAMLVERATFQPREWVLAHMTDEICARALYDVIRAGWEQRGATGHQESRKSGDCRLPTKSASAELARGLS
jgi:hypothetical protein